MTRAYPSGLVEALPDGVAVLDAEHRYVYVNVALQELLGARSGELIGRRNDEVMPRGDAALWREALDSVSRTGTARSVECTLDTPRGPRRFASLISKLPSGELCAVSRDVTDVESGRLLAIAAGTMSTGMAIVEAPSGRVLFKNDETDRLFGSPSRSIAGIEDYDAIVAYGVDGQRIANDEWPVVRALTGKTVVGERVEVDRHGRRRTISINASPVRNASGQIIAAVSTYHDVTEARRAHDTAVYLAAAGAVLQRFDPDVSLQAIVDLAVPELADWCFVHLTTGSERRLAAIAHANAERVAEERTRHLTPLPQMRDTPVARVLAGGPPELIDVDAAVLASAARDPEHLAHLRAQGYRSAVVAPLSGREGVLGAITFVRAESGRRYEQTDLDMLAELARRTGIALDNARLFAAERSARREAEEARERTRRLQKLTELLSATVDEGEVVPIMLGAGREALGASAGFAWLLRDSTTLELAAAQPEPRKPEADGFRILPLATELPVCEVVRSARPLMFENVAEMTARFPLAVPPSASSSRAWAVTPLVVRDRAIGAISFAFEQERAFSDEDRRLLAAMIGQTSIAFERCRLLQAERRAREEAEASRQRERQLHVLAARLSSALTPQRVAAIVCEEVVGILRAYSGAAAIRVGDQVHIIGIAGPRDDEALALVTKVPLQAAVPIAEAVLTSELVWCGSEAELARRYLDLKEIWSKLGIRSWGAVPFTFEGRTVGSLAVSCLEERELAAEERELLHAAGQLAAQALERARLYEAHTASEDQLRLALSAARAATWRVDIATMTSWPDPSYRALIGGPERGAADFTTVHPEDRHIAEAHFRRAMNEGLPYEPEVRVRRDDGSYIWIRAHGRLVYDERGAPTVMAGVVVDIDEVKRAALRADEERRINETLYRLGNSFASELDHDRLMLLITEAITKLVGAETGSFHEVGGDPMPGAAFGSELKVRVVGRSGELFGTLVFGHRNPGRFTPEHERLAANIASQAAVALDNARLYTKVLEQKEQLEHAVERASLADRRKDEFLAMLGHELRNPLAPIATALSLMDLEASETFRRERDVIQRQVQHLTRLVDDLLDVSRITRGKIQLAKQSVEIGVVLAKAVEMASPLLEQRMQRLTLDVPRAGLPVEADSARLAQAFQNLLTNAAKYSDTRSEIVLRAHAERDTLLVELRDHGIGIPAELKPRLFDLFVQGERSLDRSQGGLGIGLSIAKSLCELHGGTIEVESAGLGQGSTFKVRLPLGRAQVADSAPPDRDWPTRASTRRRVLVVDDNVDAAQTLQEFLLARGHEIAIAHDGLSALAIATAFKPSIALLDIGLPVMDGYELAQRLRAELGPHVRLIAVTGYGQESDRARTRQAGFDRHLVKPVALDTLVTLLEGEQTATEPAS